MDETRKSGIVGKSGSQTEMIGGRVRDARLKQRMTGQELGDAVGLRKDQISKIESGIRRVQFAELPLLANALGVSVRHLLGMDEPAPIAMAARLASGTGPEAMRPARRRARQLLEVDDLLTRMVDMPQPAPTPQGMAVQAEAATIASQKPGNRVQARDQGKRLASVVRRELDLGADGLTDLPALIEQHFAADVALSPMGTATDGLCVHSGDRALILASSDYPLGHARFTAAHELGHHLFQDPQEVFEESEADMYKDTEQESRVNAFAASLLMPEAGIKAALNWLGERKGSVSERSRVALMEKYGVSHAALIFQLVDVGFISFETGQLMKRRSVSSLVRTHANVAPTGASTEPTRVSRPPERYLRYALQAARDQRLGLSVVATLLDVPDDDALWRYVMGSEDNDERDEVKQAEFEETF